MILCDRRGHAALALVVLATVGCGARSSLESTTTDGDGPACADESPQPVITACETRFEACLPWSEPLELGSSQLLVDSALGSTGAVTIVATHEYEDGSDELIAVAPDGTVLWRRDVQFGPNPRIAYHHEHGRGLIAAKERLVWLGADGQPCGGTHATSPFPMTVDGRKHAGVAAAPVADGFVIVVTPTHDPPEHLRGGLFAKLPLTSRAPTFVKFSDMRTSSGIRISTDLNGIAQRVGFGWLSKNEVLQFGWDGATFVGPVARHDGNDMSLGFVTVGSTSYVARTDHRGLSVIGMHDDGSLERWATETGEQHTSPGRARIDRLASGELIIATTSSEEPSLIAFDPASGAFSAPIRLGPPGGSAPQLARTPRGLAALWCDSGDRMLMTQLECCIE